MAHLTPKTQDTSSKTTSSKPYPGPLDVNLCVWSPRPLTSGLRGQEVESY